MTWPRVSLRELGQWYGGGTPSKANAAFWQDGPIPWLSPKDMGPNTLVDTQDHITGAAVSGSAVKVVPSGSVAVVVRSGILERTLPIALVPFETTLNQDMKAVVPRDGVDTRWIAWGLRAFERELLRTTRKAGTTVASIEMPRFHSFELPVPALDEQRRIIDILEDHLSRLDASERYASSALTRLARVDESAVRELLGDVQVERALGEILELPLGNGRSVPTRDDGFPVLRLTALKDGGVDLRERKGGDWTRADAQRFLVSRGDFLVARGNGSLRLVGRGSLVRDEPDPVAYPDTAIRARTARGVMTPDFLDVVWNSRRTRAQIEAMARTTAGIYKVNQKQLSAVRLSVPPLSDQERIVASMAEIDGQVRRTREALAQMQRRGTVLRRTLLAAAFTGKLTGRHTGQEVIDELASAD